jgi:alkylation response protein AidB-like acyl-CoA dehydrogenase
MDFQWSAEHLELREAVRDFAARTLAAPPRDPDLPYGFRRDLWARCAEFGILGLPVPRVYGGGETDVMGTTLAMEALGYGCPDHGLLFSIHAHMWAVTTPLLAFGTEDQKQAYLPGLCDGHLIGAHAMSEPDSGSDAFSLRTRGQLDGDDYVLNGVKTFVTNAPVADVFVVFANVRPERGMWGVTAFLLERGMAGLEVSKPIRKMGLKGSPMAEVVLTDCRMPVSARLGAEGQGATVFNHSMGWERACILGSQVGRMERQLEMCVEYARERRQFGRPVGDFQLVAAKLAVMRMRLETSRLLLYRAAWAQHTGEEVGLYSAMAKLHISEAAVASGLDALQVHGGYGYMEEFAVEEQLRDAIGGRLYSGTSEIQQLVIARHLGFSPQ